MKFSWNDILIVGDSFASIRNHQDDWPMSLALQLTHEEYVNTKIPRGFGFPGGAWWSVRNNLLKELSICVPKVLVICHTNEDRLPSDFDYGLNAGVIDSPNNLWKPESDTNYVPEMFKATEYYFKYLYSPAFHLWAMEQWFNELDCIIEEHNIEIVVHLHCFSKKDSPQGTLPKIFKNGITSKEILFQTIIEKYNHGFNEPIGCFKNHFKIEDNPVFAKSLYNAIINFTTDQNGTVQNLNLLGD